MSFNSYLILYYKTHPRARRLNKYESVWETLRQLYYDICHKVVADGVGKKIPNVRLFMELSHQAGLADCIQYLHEQFCSKRGLLKCMRNKHIVGHNGLHCAIY